MNGWTMDFPEGRKVEGSSQPEGWVGTLDSHDEAIVERVKLAQRYFPQAEPEDFQRRGRHGRIWVDRAGSEFTEVSGSPLLSERPADLRITWFVVSDGRLVFLRARGDNGMTSTLEIGDVGAEKHAAHARRSGLGLRLRAISAQNVICRARPFRFRAYAGYGSWSLSSSRACEHSQRRKRPNSSKVSIADGQRHALTDRADGRTTCLSRPC
jgi:hypothetical protein